MDWVSAVATFCHKFWRPRLKVIEIITKILVTLHKWEASMLIRTIKNMISLQVHKRPKTDLEMQDALLGVVDARVVVQLYRVGEDWTHPKFLPQSLREAILYQNR